MLALALLVLVSACTASGDPGGDASPSKTSRAPSSSADPVLLRFAVYGGPQLLRAYQRLANAFMREHPAVHILLERAATGAESRRRLDRQFAAGNGPDVFVTDSSLVPSLVAEGRVQPVDGLLEERGIQFGDNYERLGLEAMADNAALQCMPNDVSPYVVFYNKRLMNTSLLPSGTNQPPRPERNGWSWNQFTVAAAQMSTDRAKGLYLPPGLTTLTPLMRSAGRDIVDNPTQPTTLTLSPSSNRGAMRRILDVARNQTITLTPRELAAQSPVSRFLHGRLGMMVGTRALVPRLRQNPELRFDVYPMPSLGRGQTVAEVSGYCINHDTQHQSAAADFLAFASGDKGSTITSASGAIVPANLNVQNSDAFTQTNHFPLNVGVFTRVIRRATLMPNPPAWADVVQQTRPLVRRLFYSQRNDLDVLLPEIDRISAPLLAQPTPSPSQSPSQSPSESPGQSPGQSPTGSPGGSPGPSDSGSAGATSGATSGATATSGDQPRDLAPSSRSGHGSPTANAMR